MSFSTISAFRPVAAATAALVTAIAFSNAAAQPALRFAVENVRVCSDEQTVIIDVYLSNYVDNVAGFTFWCMLDRPDVIRFAAGAVVDTTYWDCLVYSGPDCTDSIEVEPYEEWDFSHVDTIEVYGANIDTVGTLISGWEMVDSRSLTGLGYDIKVTGLADLPKPPVIPSLAPQSGGTLVRLVADVIGLPNDTAYILVQTSMLQNFQFVRPNGSVIGVDWQAYEDTACWVCDSWSGDSCLVWRKVPVPPPGGCDSTEIVIDSIPVLDTVAVVIEDGSVVISAPILGDIDGNGTSADIADLVYLVTWMFGGGPGAVCVDAADCDHNGAGPDIADLVCWVEYMF